VQPDTRKKGREYEEKLEERGRRYGAQIEVINDRLDILTERLNLVTERVEGLANMVCPPTTKGSVPASHAKAAKNGLPQSLLVTTCIEHQLPARSMNPSSSVSHSDLAASLSVVVDLTDTTVRPIRGKGQEQCESTSTMQWRNTRTDMINFGMGTSRSTLQQGEATPVIDFVENFDLECLLPRGTVTYEEEAGDSTIDLIPARRTLCYDAASTRLNVARITGRSRPAFPLKHLNAQFNLD
jgi:hypothetical protein